MWENYRLVYAITIHPELGNLIEAFAVLLNKDDSFTLTYSKVNTSSLDRSKYVFDQTDEEIISFIDQFHEQAIVNKFSKKSNRYHEFLLKECNEDLIRTHIRPYIEKRIDKIIRLLIKNSIPLYFKGERSDYITDRPVILNSKPAEVIFNFNRTTEEIRYFLSIKDGEQAINLYEKKAHILSNEPAWIFIGNACYTFEKNFDSKKLTPFFNKQYVSIGNEFEEKYFKTFILQSIKNYGNINPKGFKIEELFPDATPRLKVEKDWQDNGILKLEFRYDKIKFDANSTDLNHVKLNYSDTDILFRKINRNLQQERAFIKKLLDTGLEFKAQSTLKVKSPGISNEADSESVFSIINWLNEHKQGLLEQGFEIKQNLEGQDYFTENISVDINLKKTSDWFDLHAVVRFGSYEVAFTKLKRHLLYGKREYQLPDGRIAILPEEWFSKYKDLLIFSKADGNKLKIDKQHMQVIKESFPDHHRSFQDDFAKLEKVDQLDSITLPENLNAELRPYQKLGFDWMYFLGQNQLGACLADDMGLGKTVQTLALLQKGYNEFESDSDDVAHEEQNMQLDLFTYINDVGIRNTSLIIMPTSLIYNWIREIGKFTPHLRWMAHVGFRRSRHNKLFKFHDIVLTSYGIVRNDLKLFKDFEFNYIILDESQFIKNPDSKIFKAVSQLKSKNRLILTGTPIENSLTDLWAQMSFINPGLLGEIQSFKKEFMNPIEKNQDEQKQERLKKLIQPFILRRTKDQVAKDLPDLTEDIRYCEMSDAQKKFYEKRKSEIRNLIFSGIESFGIEKRMMAILRGLMELRMAANHPVMMNKDYDGDSGKFDEVSRQMSNIISGGHKILVFSSFVRHLNIFKDHFEKKKIKFELLTGSVAGHKRKGLVDNFQNNPDVPVFLISLKAGGVGLNLTAADYVFILDPWWNPAVEMQAINRAHRIGQDKKVFSYKFISKESIEEKILELQDKKKFLANEFVNNNNPLKAFTEKEIEKLFE